MTEEKENKLPDGQQGHKSRKMGSSRRRKQNRLWTVLMVLLFCVMLFSAYQIIRKVRGDNKAKEVYSALVEEVVQTMDPPPAYIPEELPTFPPESSADMTEAPSAADPTAPSATVPPTAPDPSAVVPSESGEEPTVPPTSPIVTEAPTPIPPEPTTEAPKPTSPPQTAAPQPQGPIPLPWLSVNFGALKAKNSLVIAWLQGQDGSINYPVIQGSDNSYYLRRLLDGSYNTAGTLFADYRNNFLKDDVSFIYGHRMDNGTMFGQLWRYENYYYYLNHPILRLYTESAIYELQVVSALFTDISEDLSFNFQDKATFDQVISKYRAQGKYQTNVSVQYGDKLVCLYTCSYHIRDGRLWLLCKLVRVA